MVSSRRQAASWLDAAALVIGLAFCLAPTPGDIGGCGEAAQDLDPAVFFASKQAIECRRCEECGQSTPACERACAEEEVASAFPEGCHPLVHDGTVCLRALSRASCEDHAKVVTEPASVPSECNFCPLP